MSHHFARLYLQKVADRNKIEREDRPLFEDMIEHQRALRDLQYKFSICNKQSDLLQKVESLES
jgi:hypothetical protein